MCNKSAKNKQQGEHGNMKRKKQKKIKAAVVGLLLAIMMVSNHVYASEQTGSITIYYRTVNEKEEEQTWEGVPFELYYVGKTEKGQIEFHEAFVDSGISLSDTSSSARHEQAERLYEYAKQEQISAVQGKTNQNGRVTFDDLKLGIYLVAQSEHMTDAVTGGNWFSSPFLVSVPTWIGDKLVYQVTAEPKTEYVPIQTSIKPTPEPPKKSDNVKTGDSMPIELLLIVLTSSVCLIVILWKKKKNPFFYYYGTQCL